MEDSENKTIVVINEDGQEVEAELISYFELEEFGKEYAFYSFGEVDSNGLVKLNVSTVQRDGKEYTFTDVETEEEWVLLKKIMKDIAVSKERD